MSEVDSRDSFVWLYFLRQLLICSGVWTTLFMLGISYGSITVLVPQLRKEANSSEAISVEMASWLPAVCNYAAIPWVIILPILATIVGRKITHIIVSATTLIGFIIYYCSNNVTEIFISEVFQGPLFSSSLTVLVLITTEYSSSKYRGVFLTIKSASFYWGVLVLNLIGTFFNWRNITLLGIVCSAYNLATVFLWPESPFWLAKKGHYDQCAKAHRWLKGSKMDAEKELQTLLANQRCNKKIPFKIQITNNFKLLVSKEFCKPILFSLLLITLYIFSGKLVLTVYSIDILKNITNNESAAYTGMLILDSVTVCTMYVGCVLVKSFKRRSMLLTSSSIAALFMFSVFLYLYLTKLSIISENRYLSISLLIGYSVAISCGPVIICSSISAELIPLESRNLSVCITALCSKIMNGTFMKVFPYLILKLEIHGTFLFFAFSSIFCLVPLYLYLPETKDKTLQEISDCIKGVKPVDEVKELLPVVCNEEIKVHNSFRGYFVRFYNKIPNAILELTENKFKKFIKSTLCRQAYYKLEDYLLDKNVWRNAGPAPQDEHLVNQ